jgi:hypothetical protein
MQITKGFSMNIVQLKHSGIGEGFLVFWNYLQEPDIKNPVDESREGMNQFVLPLPTGRWQDSMTITVMMGKGLGFRELPART